MCGLILRDILILFVIANLGYVSTLNKRCDRDPTNTLSLKTSGDNGFKVKLLGLTQQDTYIPGQIYTVALNGTYEDQAFIGFYLVAVPANTTDERKQLGTFQHSYSEDITVAGGCSHVITHNDRVQRTSVSVSWIAPPPGSGCVEFRATILEHNDIWYKDDGALKKTYCEKGDNDNSVKKESSSTECCACGAGKYQMTFHGLWSRQSHPKDWPHQKRLLHWSNIVGASHSKHYKIWEYGNMASKGIQQVCEFGYSRTLEQEMREHSRDVRTVIKTPGIWYNEAEGLHQERWARFSVDKRNHYLSILTMIGPSPDWCVGVSSLNLCLVNCSWVSDLEVYLYPWDAGTDDGLSYMASNAKTIPQEFIKKITKEGNHNPFKGTEQIKPMAKLMIHRIFPKPGENKLCNETEDFDAYDISNEISNIVENNPKDEIERKCGVGNWQQWSTCSVTCGSGRRSRKRAFDQSMSGNSMCHDLAMEKEKCQGDKYYCEEMGQKCAMTDWSDWSPCSETCGKGTHLRRRYYLNKDEKSECNRNDEETEMCVSDMLECKKIQMMKNFTAICAMPMMVGPCRGFFMRWYYDQSSGHCHKFAYGGCRGNGNQFRNEEECISSCQGFMMKDETMDKKNNIENEINKPKPMKKEVLKHKKKRSRRKSSRHSCKFTSWSQWSECTATCGKSAFQYRERLPEEEYKNNTKCLKSLKRTKRCKLPKCENESKKMVVVDCKVSHWSDWSICSATCGKGYKYKRRTIEEESQFGGKSCPKKLEKQKICEDLSQC